MDITSQTILVLGATGLIGRALVRELAATGARVRAATRRPESYVQADDRIRAVHVDLDDPASVARAATGVDAVHLLWPHLEAASATARRAAPVGHALAEHAPRVVVVSSETASRQADTPWGAVEDAVAAVVDDCTMLRPTGFASNALQWLPQIVAGGAVRCLLPDMARPLIDERDIAAVSATALLTGRLAGERPILSGPALIRQRDQIAVLADVLGTSVEVVEIDRAEAAAEGVPAAMLDAWTGFVAQPEPVSDAVQRWSGRAATTFATWAHDHADEIRAAARRAIAGVT